MGDAMTASTARIATVCLGSSRNQGEVRLASRSRSGSVAAIAEPVPGPTTDAVAERARAHHAYVICPLLTARAGRCYSSAVVIDRIGAICGVYDKTNPVTSINDYTELEGGATPGRSDLESACLLIEPRDRKVTTAALMEEFGLERCSTCFRRHTAAYEELREGRRPAPQIAALGDRPQYSA
jgi:hypothetical protein